MLHTEKLGGPGDEAMTKILPNEVCVCVLGGGGGRLHVCELGIG